VVQVTQAATTFLLVVALVFATPLVVTTTSLVVLLVSATPLAVSITS
jgi:hypothetical protein